MQNGLTIGVSAFIISVREFRGNPMTKLIQNLWADDQGQDIAEYAVMLAVILLLVVGTIRLIGTNANSTFSNVASNLQ